MDCSGEDRKPPSEFFIVDFDFEEVIGDTYNAVVSHLQSFKFRSQEGGAPPGHHINYGDVTGVKAKLEKINNAPHAFSPAEISKRVNEREEEARKKQEKEEEKTKKQATSKRQRV
jgi:hypothetical protein